MVAQRVGEFLRAASYNSRCFCVVDFDMFYAAVEIRDKPGLAQLPVAVGGIGMISTANYVARRWGVRSAMPGFVGQQLCRRGPEFGMPKAELVPCCLRDTDVFSCVTQRLGSRHQNHFLTAWLLDMQPIYLSGRWVIARPR